MSLAEDILKNSKAGKDTPAASASDATETPSTLSLNSLSDKVPKTKKEDDAPAATPVSMPVKDASPSLLSGTSSNKGGGALNSLTNLVGYDRPAAPKRDGGLLGGIVDGTVSNIVGQVVGVKEMFIKKQDDTSTLIATTTGVKTGNESVLNNAASSVKQIGGVVLDLGADNLVDPLLGTKLSDGKTSAALGKAFNKSWQDLKSGDAYTRGEVIGNILGFTATAAIGTGGAAKTARGLSGNVSEMGVLAQGYKQANLAVDAISGIKTTSGLADDALKVANTARTAEVIQSASLMSRAGQRMNQIAESLGITGGGLKPAYAFPEGGTMGSTAKSTLSNVAERRATTIDNLTGHTPSVIESPLTSGKFATRVEGLKDTRHVVQGAENTATKVVAKDAAGTEANATRVAEEVAGSTKLPGHTMEQVAGPTKAPAHTVDQVSTPHAKDVIEPAGGTKAPGHPHKVEPGHVADDGLKAADPAANSAQRLPIDQPPRNQTLAGEPGTAKVVAGATDDAIKPGTNVKAVDDVVQPKAPADVPVVNAPIEKVQVTAQTATEQVVASGVKLSDTAAALTTTATGSVVGSNLDEIARLSRNLGQGTDDLVITQIKGHVDEIARAGGDDVATKLRLGIDEVERHANISRTASSLETTSKTLATQTTNFSDEAARLAGTTNSPLIGEKLEDISRLSRTLGTGVEDAATLKSMRTAIDDIARNGGSDIAKKLTGSLDELERTTSSVSNLRLVQKVEESALAVNKQMTTITDDLATKVTGTAAPTIRQELKVLSQATDDLVKGTDAAAATRVSESLNKLERLSVGTNVADDVSKLANQTAKLESTVTISRTAQTLEATTAGIVKQAGQLADNVASPSIQSQASKIARTTGNTVVTEQLDEISRLSSTLGRSSDDARVLQQIKEGVNTIARNGGDDIAKQLRTGVDELERSVSSASSLKITQKVEESALTLRTHVANLSDDIVAKVPGATGPAIREELKVLSRASDDLVKGLDETAAVRVRESLTRIEGVSRGTAAADDVSKLANVTAKLESTVNVASTTRALETTTQTLGTQSGKLTDDIAKLSQTAPKTTPVAVVDKLEEMSKLANTIGKTGDDLVVVQQLRKGIDEIGRAGSDDIARHLRSGVDELERTAKQAQTLKLTQKVEESALSVRTQVGNLADDLSRTPGINAATSGAFKAELKNLTTATDDMVRGGENAAARVRESLKNLDEMSSGTRFAENVGKLADDSAKLQSSVNISRTARTLETTTETMVGQAAKLTDDATRFATTTGTNAAARTVTEKLDEISQLSRTIGKSGDDLTVVQQIGKNIDEIARAGGDDIARQLRTGVDELERTAKQAQTLKLTQKVEETALSVRTQVGNLADDVTRTPGINAATSSAFKAELKNLTTATDDMVRGGENAAARVRESLKNLDEMATGSRFAENVGKLADDSAKLQSSVNISRTARTLETTTETMVGQAAKLTDDATRFATTTGTNAATRTVTEKLDEISQLSRTIGKSGDDLSVVQQIGKNIDEIARAGGDDIAKQLRTGLDDVERSARQAQSLKLTQKVEETALSVRTQVGSLTDDLIKVPGTGSQAVRTELRNLTNATDDLIRGADDAAAVRVRSSVDKLEQLTAGNSSVKLTSNVSRIVDDAVELQSAVNASRTFAKLETTTQSIVAQGTRLSDDTARLATTTGNTVVREKLDEISQLSRNLGKTGDDLGAIKQIQKATDDIARNGGDDIARQLRNNVDDLERSALNANRIRETQRVQELATNLRTQLVNATDNVASPATTAAVKQELKNLTRATDDLVRGADDVVAMRNVNTSVNNLQQLSSGTRISDDVARLADDTKSLQKTVTASRTANEIGVATEKLVASGTRLSDDAAKLATTSSKVVTEKLDEIATASKTLGKTGDDLKAIQTIKNNLDDIARAGGDNVVNRMRPVVAEAEQAAITSSRFKEVQRLAVTVEDDAARIARNAKQLSETVVGTSTEARIIRQQLNTIARTADELPTAANQGAQVSKIKAAVESIKEVKGVQFVDDLERTVTALDTNVVKSSTLKVFSEQGARVENLAVKLQDDLAKASQKLNPMVMDERRLLGDLATTDIQTSKLITNLRTGSASLTDNAASHAEDLAAVRRSISEIAAKGHTSLADDLTRTVNGIDEAIKIQKFEQISAQSDTLAALLKQKVIDIPNATATEAVRTLQQTALALPTTGNPQMVLSSLRDGIKALEGTAGGAAIVDQLSPIVARLEASLTQQRALTNNLIDSSVVNIESQIRNIQTAGRLATQQEAIATTTENVQFLRHLTLQTDSKMAMQAEQAQQHLTRLDLAAKAASRSEVARAGQSRVLAMAESGDEAASSKLLLHGLKSDGSRVRGMVDNSGSFSNRVGGLMRSNGLFMGLVNDSQVRRAMAGAALNAAGFAGSTGLLGLNAYYHTVILPRKINQEHAEQEQLRQQLQLERSSGRAEQPESRTDAAQPTEARADVRKVDLEFIPSVAEAARASQMRTLIPTDGIAARHGINPNDPDARTKENSLIQTGRIYSWSNKGAVGPTAEGERANLVATAKSLRIRPTTGGAQSDSGIRLPKTAVAEYEFSYTRAMALNNQVKLLATATDGRRTVTGGNNSRYGASASTTSMSTNLRTMIAHNAFRSEGLAHGNQVLSGAEATENTGLDQNKSGGAAPASGPQLAMNQDGTFSVVSSPVLGQDPNGGNGQPAQVLAHGAPVAVETNLVDQLAQKYAVSSESEATTV